MTLLPISQMKQWEIGNTTTNTKTMKRRKAKITRTAALRRRHKQTRKRRKARRRRRHSDETYQVCVCLFHSSLERRGWRFHPTTTRHLGLASRASRAPHCPRTPYITVLRCAPPRLPRSGGSARLQPPEPLHQNALSSSLASAAPSTPWIARGAAVPATSNYWQGRTTRLPSSARRASKSR